MSTPDFVAWVGIAAGIATLVIQIRVHIEQRRQGRLPGQRWDKDKGEWVD